MGLTYKENVVDIRETSVRGIINELGEYGVKIFGHDPILSNIESEFGIKAVPNLGGIRVDGVILAVVHDAFKQLTLGRLMGIMNDNPVLIDVRGFFSREEALEKGFCYQSL